jgi:Flp pilus assembly protein TadD
MTEKLTKSISFLLFFALIFTNFSLIRVFAQSTKPSVKSASLKANPKPTPKPKKTPKVVLDEKTAFEKAKSMVDPTERINYLRKFKSDFPATETLNRASELIVSAYAELADVSLKDKKDADGVNYFKLAVKEIPSPVSDQLFVNVVLQFPTNLYYRGLQPEAVEIANQIEEKVGGTPKYLLALATFFLGTENGERAKSLAEKAIIAEPNSVSAYQTLGLANRINFDLAAAESAYAKASELDPESVVSKRSLAEIKRSNGKSLESETLYREILEKSPEDSIAKTGLILALLDSGKKAEAELEIAGSLETNANNLQLLVGIAYWYAANNNGDKAVEYSKRAVEIERRYVWAHIALARGLLLQGKPIDAERTLLVAKQFGNFPTLSYELATIRCQAGFYEEASEELASNFTIKDGEIETKLGARITQKSGNFIELLAPERRASIFEPVAADSVENSNRLKTLLDFNQKLLAAEPDEAELSKLAETFSQGTDKNRTFRQLFVASRLLDKKLALNTVLKLAQSATASVDIALDSPSASSATMSDQLIDTRKLAISRGTTIVFPEIPRATLSNILRSRIEELGGWTLYQQGKFPEAVVRLKRAAGIAPDKSAWWRSSMWRLGSALDAAGNQKEALTTYVKVYRNSESLMSKRLLIEFLYQKMNGKLDGLDELLGDSRPVDSTAKAIPTPEISKTPTPEPVSTPPIPKPETTPSPEPTPTLEVAKPVDNAGDSRPRVIVTSTLPPAECIISLSQENVSLLSGSQLGILVVLRGDVKINQLKAFSASPDDLTVNLEPDFIKGSNRGFYNFRSVSGKIGEFKVTFELPCGKKEVLVKVR